MEKEQSAAACGVSGMGSGNAAPNANANAAPNAAPNAVPNTVPNTSTSTSRPAVPQISVYSGIPDRQTVQVIQQALHRQPSTAAQYLQQMYAAQQQHLMLQTAALQQQQLSSAQLQSLAAVQQASLAAGRQNSSQNGASTQQAGSTTQTTINLTASPAAAQLISRAQSVSSAPAGITQQAVLLGNASSPALTASQAQMYLRAQMLIFTPTATVTTVQPEATAQPAGQAATAQVQNLALRGQQGSPAVSAAGPQPQLQGLSLKQTPAGPQLSLSGLVPPLAQLKGPGTGTGSGTGAGGKGPGGSEAPGAAAEGGGGARKGGDQAPSAELLTRVVNVSRNVTSVTNHHLITPAYTQIQPHQLLQQHKQQFVIQPQRVPTPLLQHQHQNQNQNQAQIQLPAQAQALPIQPGHAPQCAVPVLPKPPIPAHQATIFHSQAPPKPQPVQLTAVNLQIQPAPAPTPTPAPAPAARMAQDCTGGDQPTPLVVRETCPVSRQPVFAPPLGVIPAPERLRSDPSKLALQEQDPGGAEGLNAKHGGGGRPSSMTSGNGSGAGGGGGGGGGGPTVAGSATPQNGESKPPQAIVKPQILTHVIEGFVIQEGAEPFPVERPSLLLESLKKPKAALQPDGEKLPQNSANALRPSLSTISTDAEMEDLSQPDAKEQEADPMLKCELCGLVDFASNFKRSKRFCSTVCAKRYSVHCSKRMGLIHPDRSKMEKHKRGRSRGSTASSAAEAKKQAPSAPPPQSAGGTAASPPRPHTRQQGGSSQCSDLSSYEDHPPSPLSAASSGVPPPPPPIRPAHHGERGAEPGQGHAHELPLLTQHFLPRDPAQWNVREVYEFICSLPGCQEIAEEFRSQEIDGQALLLLKEDHLMSAMNIKLGPALKIFARISLLRDS